jgi:hypothetical protein
MLLILYNEMSVMLIDTRFLPYALVLFIFFPFNSNYSLRLILGAPFEFFQLLKKMIVILTSMTK